MFHYKVKTLYLLLVSLVLFKLNSGFSLNRNKRSPLEINVLDFKHFTVHLPEGTLLNFRVNINRELSDNEAADFEKNKTDGNVLRFSRSDLNLKRGDYIYYHGLFEESDGSLQGEAGTYIFDGVFKPSKKQKREVTEEINESNSDSNAVENRFGYYGGRRYGSPSQDYPNPSHFGSPHLHHSPNGPPHGHFHGHHHDHFHGHQHGHFHGHQHGHSHGVPFHERPGKSPYFYPGYQLSDFWGWLAKYKPFWSPDHWNGRGHGHGNKFGPWCRGDGNGGGDIGATKRPWNSGPEVEPVTVNIVTSPTTKSTTTTTTTTTTPKIDIRFPDVE